MEALSSERVRELASGPRDKDTLLVLYAPWCPFCQGTWPVPHLGLLAAADVAMRMLMAALLPCCLPAACLLPACCSPAACLLPCCLPAAPCLSIKQGA